MKIRYATRDDTSLILTFIQKKSEFDRNIGALEEMRSPLYCKLFLVGDRNFL